MMTPSDSFYARFVFHRTEGTWGSASPKHTRQGCLSVFFAIFLTAGLFFAVVLLHNLYESGIAYTWTRTYCAILSSRGLANRGAKEDDPPYLFQVRYRYAWQGVEYVSQQRSLRESGFWDWSQASRLERTYPAGGTSDCYVDPAQPSRTVLERGDFWLAFALPLPLVFVLIGGGGIYFTWLRGARDRSGRESISEKVARPGRTRILVTMLLLMTFIGGGVLVAVFLRPALRLLESPSWKVTTCRVEFSRVGRHKGDKSTTYSADILYSY